MSDESGGPVPVRDLLEQMHPEPSRAEEKPRQETPEYSFEEGGEVWLARVAGAGAYGTGRMGGARLVAVHFCRAAESEIPVREALLPQGRFPHMGEDELRALFEKAAPIELER